ncbi:DUF1963 domain-containing protein [Kibdelosporangium persicum]|uniref:DUF1963 domain-containing protein n=1 Tax=Kibdelosporangium persicum TaxID=2698649 RepID=A0ABX2FBI3_9PSEU|nr:DUF1963 domain-containing protein [Kibdelosporangium persicum]NRN68738.1 hypothetical protein [Kibdelosporangium persicum]
MDRYEQFRRAAIDRGIPDDEVGKFADQLRFAVWTAASGSGEEVVGQRGGLPRLPVGMEWPGGGYPLPFIASVDCALLPRAEGLPLPVDGTLLFFLHHEADVQAHPNTDKPGFARVLYVPAGTDTAVAPPPPDHDSTRFFDEDMPFLIPECGLSAWVEPVLPQWIRKRNVNHEPDAVQDLFEELKHIDELCELVDGLWPVPDQSSLLRIGGYCMKIGGQDSPWTRMAEVSVMSRHGTGSDLSTSDLFRLCDAEESRLIREWVPLAQFLTESDYHYGCFLISLDDLAAKRFDTMLSFTMFTE